MKTSVETVFERNGKAAASRGKAIGAVWRNWRRGGALLAVVALVTGGASGAGAAQASFDAIFSTNAADFAVCQIKFTYTGPQTKTTPTLLLVGPGRSQNIAEFAPYQTAGVDYGNDSGRVIVLNVSADTLRKVVLGMSEREVLKASGTATNATLSVMIERGQPPGELVFEHLAGNQDIDQMMNVLQGAVQGEPVETKEMVRRFRNFTAGPI